MLLDTVGSCARHTRLMTRIEEDIYHDKVGSLLSSNLPVVAVNEERWPVASAAPLVPFLRSLRQLIANPPGCAR